MILLNRSYAGLLSGNIVQLTTQLEAQLSPTAQDYFINSPFGNHHLILPGNWAQRLKLSAKFLRMEVIE